MNIHQLLWNIKDSRRTMASKKNTILINLHGNEYMALIQIIAIATSLYFEVGFQNEVYACNWDFRNRSSDKQWFIHQNMFSELKGLWLCFPFSFGVRRKSHLAEIERVWSLIITVDIVSMNLFVCNLILLQYIHIPPVRYFKWLDFNNSPWNRRLGY